MSGEDVFADLGAEVDELHATLVRLSEAEVARPTPFLGWTPWDVVAHLHFFDRISLLAAADTAAFAAARQAIRAGWARGERSADQARRELGALGWNALLEHWRDAALELAARLARAPDARLPWFGPDMGARSFASARLMETWAHGQDVHDLLQRPRAATDRLHHVALLGVKTYGWSFANRGLEPPGPAPHVRLAAPSGATWEWHAGSPGGRVEGSALDFCLVVTQARNVADTALQVAGEAATRWLAIAQCFAGRAVDPPKPGERAWS